MRTMAQDNFKAIPQLTQTQAALGDQLYDLIFIAQRCGMYDAADYLKDKLKMK